MKLTFRYIIFAAVGVSAVFVSCSKELGNVDLYEGQPDGVRIISAGFDNSTKVSISGNLLSFRDGDLIRVSDNSKSEVCTLKVVAGKATFETTLQGEVTAIYPSDAAFLSSSDADAPIVSPWFKVPANQDGTIAKAVIAKATIAKGDLTATFRNQTALFQITPPSTAKKIIIKSLKPVESGAARTGTAAEINTDGTGKTVITVGDGSANLSSPIYVALKPGVNLTDLSFDAGETIGMKGIPTSKLGSYSDATAANTKYTINNTNWHPYVIIGGLKWATMNVGATDATGIYSTSYGHLYQWGSLTTLYTGIPWSNANTVNVSWKSGKESGFVTANLEYNGTAATLPLERDIAYVDWGGPWRMPTGGSVGEFQALVNASSLSDVTLSEVRFKLFTSKSDASKKLYFPSAGYGGESDKNPKEPNHTGHCWSSTISSNSGQAYGMGFSHTSIISGGIWPQDSKNREMGFSIRPVADL